MNSLPKGAPARVCTYSDPAVMRSDDEGESVRTGATGATKPELDAMSPAAAARDTWVEVFMMMVNL